MKQLSDSFVLANEKRAQKYKPQIDQALKNPGIKAYVAALREQMKGKPCTKAASPAKKKSPEPSQ